MICSDIMARKAKAKPIPTKLKLLTPSLSIIKIHKYVDANYKDNFPKFKISDDIIKFFGTLYLATNCCYKSTFAILSQSFIHDLCDEKKCNHDIIKQIIAVGLMLIDKNEHDKKMFIGIHSNMFNMELEYNKHYTNIINELQLTRHRCMKCDGFKLATWCYAPTYKMFFCDEHVPRGCTCQLDMDTDEPLLDEQNRELPCCEYDYCEDGFLIYDEERR